MKYFLILFTVLVTPTSAFAQVTVEQTQALSFGTIIVVPEGDEIRVRPNGRVTSNNGSDLQGAGSGALFRISGEPNETVSYSISAGNTLNGNGQSLSLEQFQFNRSNPFTLNSNGRRNLRIGARLIIPPNNIGGEFSGTFILTIDNQ